MSDETAGKVTWSCGCTQDPLGPVGEYTNRCGAHAIADLNAALEHGKIDDWDPDVDYADESEDE